MLQAKHLPSGYALGYASGKFFIFKNIAAGYAPGYASGKLYANICPQATLKGIFKKYLPLGYASGKLYANICPQAMLGATPPAKFS
ncbi:hypothetical protein T07_11954 [Trichinella nelsoni]|uniref:Uncharacterized protein n=1 Tax=Trichinella nelsoni TaxID=6336 RepID=A0A0V0SAN4_9BILA|nr:hypothetical protein T07_11954 [Trichinella nelsoni]